MKTLFKRMTKYKGALYVSGAYGVIAALLYVVGFLGGKDGPVGVWFLIYYSAWPFSYLFLLANSLLEGVLPFKLLQVIYMVGPVLTGMLWFYFLARCFLSIRAKLRPDRQYGS